jgi:excisionase family DNA binding protein
MMVVELTVKEFAQVERVDERTVRRWIDKGAVDVRRTPGGGIRIQHRQQSGAVFLRTNSDISGQSSQ